MRSNSIQYIRGLAALLVIFYHFAVYQDRINGDVWLHNLIKGRPGLYGVVAFFVLSGYLMATIAPRTSPETFLVHRIIRIYPTYWICVALASFYYAALAWILHPDASYLPAIHHMIFGSGILTPDLLRLALVPMVFPDFPLGVEWTLLYETTFYIIVGLASMIGLARHLPYMAVAWLVFLIGVGLNYPGVEARYTQPDLSVVLLFGINAGFAFGMLSSRFMSYLSPWVAFPVGVTLLAFADQVPTRLAMLETCAGIAAIVCGTIAMDQRGRLPDFPLLRRLGDWSYAMYLLHVPVILGVLRLMPEAPLAVLLPTALICVLFVSALMGQFDLALYTRLKRMADAGQKRVHMVAAAAFLLTFFGIATFGLRF